MHQSKLYHYRLNSLEPDDKILDNVLSSGYWERNHNPAF